MSFPCFGCSELIRDMVLHGSWDLMAGPDTGVSSHLTCAGISGLEVGHKVAAGKAIAREQSGLPKSGWHLEELFL